MSDFRSFADDHFYIFLLFFINLAVFLLFFALVGERTDIKSAPTAAPASCFTLQECFYSVFFPPLGVLSSGERFQIIRRRPFLYLLIVFYQLSGFFCCSSPLWASGRT